MMSFRLKTLITAAISLLSLILTVCVSDVIGRDAVSRLEKEIGRSLTLLAVETQDKLDRAMYAQLESLKALAAIGLPASKPEGTGSLAAMLSRFKSANQEFAWLTYAAPDGAVIASTDGSESGTLASNLSWFQNGLKGEYVGEANLQRLQAFPIEHPSHSSKGIIDISLPVSSESGAVIGVLGASLRPQWANEIKDTLVGSVKTGHRLDVIVLNGSRQVLLGPPELIGKSLDLPSTRAAQTGLSNYATETWTDGDSYLTGFSKSDGYRSFPGLRWIVLVRESRQEAFAAVATLQRHIFAWGAAFSALAALFAWLLAEKLSAPLLQLADTAECLRLGRQTEIDEISDYREVQVLSRSLRTLVNELTVQKAVLAKLNRSLETQVSERTAQLELQNVGLARAKTEAEMATHAKSRFLAAASHDLRQPLHALTLFARALSRRVSGDEAPMLVNQMEDALRALKGMFDALLNVSRLDAKLIQPKLAQVSIGDLIDRLSVGFREEAAQCGLRFRSRPTDWTIISDAALLETILRNLVSNALKFTKSGGVLVAARCRTGRRVIEVYDSGPGLPSAQHERIFEEFSRVEDSTAGASDGLGLGLSIARRYCELLGLRIELCSRPGHGSRFTLVLPDNIPAALAQTSNPAGLISSKLDGLNILVLDDEPLIVAALSRELADRGSRSFGYQTVADVERAIAEGQTFDAGIVDFDLRSTETGLQFIDRMGEELRVQIPFLLLSGGTDSDTLSALANSGRPWLTKPADPDLIVATLSSLCMRGGRDGRHYGSRIAP